MLIKNRLLIGLGLHINTLLSLSLILCLGYTYMSYTTITPTEVPYPEGYRQWVHIKTAIIDSDVNPVHGFHHIYANEKAVKGYGSGSFPEGSIIVFDVLEDVKKPNGDVMEGKRRMVDVMMKDQAYDSTGGWRFEEFKEDSKHERNIQHLATVKCFNCHSQKKSTDYVFSTFRK